MEKVGFTIGKFAPLHKGHQLVIETGLKEMDDFFVVIYETDLIDVNMEKRASWIKKLYPKIRIYFAKNPPKKFGLDVESVNIQMEYLTKIISDENPTHFYSSEPYGKYVAEHLEIIDRQVDYKKEKIPINATMIRKDLESGKSWLEDFVYNDLKEVTFTK